MAARCIMLLPLVAGTTNYAPSAHTAVRRLGVVHARPHLSSPQARSAGGVAADPGFAADGPITCLLEVCKEACDELSVLIRLVYDGLSTSDATLKADKSVFTIADGLVQHLLTTSLLADDVLGAVVGEEDAAVNVATRPYTVDALVVPERLWEPVDAARARLAELGARLRAAGPSGGAESLRALTAFVDPIDGTREFSSGLGEMCTICIGLAEGGRPVGGLVYRPLTQPPSWAYGCAREGVARSALLAPEASLALATCAPLPGADGGPGEDAAPPQPAASAARGLLASRGSLSPFLRALGRELPAALVRSGGAGNKALLLLEGTGDCYIQDRGLFRWDTCASQAVLEAHGGLLVQLGALAETGALRSYTYERTGVQLDFEPGLAQLTPYNAAEPRSLPPKKGGAPPRLAQRAEETKPYANVCGVCALAPGAAARVGEYAAAVRRARAAHEMEIS